MFKKLLVASLYIFICCCPLFAQVPVQGEEKGVKEFAVADVSCESSRTCNSFLKVISHSSGFPIDQARYSIFYTFSYHTSGDEVHISVCLDSVRGTTMYRGFDLSGYLLPSSIELAWACKDSSGARIPGGHREVFRDNANHYAFDALLPVSKSVHSIAPVDIQFIYREADFEDFDAASRSIQRYYAASDICDTLLQRIGNIDTKDFSNLVSGYQFYYDFRRVEKRLQQENFPSVLPLNDIDPADINGDMMRLAGRLYGLKMNLDNSLKAWRGLVKQKDARSLSGDLFQQSLFWYDLSGKVDYHYKDLYYDLGNVTDDFSVVDSLANTFRKNNALFYTEVCDLTSQKFMDAARYSLDSQNFTHAIALGNNAAFYASKAGNHNLEVDDILSLAWEGLYDSYLLVSRRTITIGNYEFAEQYLNEATGIWKQSNGAITSNSRVNEVFEHLYSSVFDQGMTSLERGVPRDALFFFREASRIDSAYLNAQNSISVLAQLNKLQHTVYYGYLEEIAYFVGNGNSFLARDYYRKAIEYQSENAISGDQHLLDSLDSEIKSLEYLDFISSATECPEKDNDCALSWLEQAAYYISQEYVVPGPEWEAAVSDIIIPIVEERLSHGRVLVWGGKIDQADHLISGIQGMVERFDLSGFPVNSLVDDLYKRIEKKKCFDLENSYRKNIFAVNACIRENNFLEASRIMEDLNVEETGFCGVDVSEAKDIQEKYGSCFLYYRFIDTCRTHLIYSRAGEAVTCYLMAVETAVNIRNSAGAFDEIKLPPLLEMYRRETLAGDIAAELFDQNPLLAAELLHFAADNGIKVDRKILHGVGIALGERDLVIDEIQDGSLYSEGRKALKPLENAYNARVKSPTNILYRALLKIYCHKDL